MQSEGEALARYKVAVDGKETIRARVMTPEEVNLRRRWIRQALIGTGYENETNANIDRMRVQVLSTGGLLVNDKNGYEFYFQSEREIRKKLQEQTALAMIPEEYRNKSGRDFDWNVYGKDVGKIKETVTRFVTDFETFKDRGMGLYIYSKTKGSGKTMLACCLLNEISNRYPGMVKFVNALDLLEMTKKGFSNDNEELDVLYMCRVLVIDDIGVQLSKEWVDTVFYRLINDRYNTKKVTIYTSNIALDALKMDDRIVDRIESTCYELHLPEVPVRKNIREQEKMKIMEHKNAP